MSCKTGIPSSALDEQIAKDREVGRRLSRKSTSVLALGGVVFAVGGYLAVRYGVGLGYGVAPGVAIIIVAAVMGSAGQERQQQGRWGRPP
mgnify:CR=1 FL=1